MKTYGHINTIQSLLYWGGLLQIIGGVVIGFSGGAGQVELTGVHMALAIGSLIFSGLLCTAIGAILELLTDIAKGNVAEAVEEKQEPTEIIQEP